MQNSTYIYFEKVQQNPRDLLVQASSLKEGAQVRLDGGDIGTVEKVVRLNRSQVEITYDCGVQVARPGANAYVVRGTFAW